MKKLFLIVSTPFWMVNLESTPRLQLLAPENSQQLKAECDDFQNTAATEKDAASFDFLRRAGSGAGAFKAQFVISQEPDPVPGVSLFAETSELKNLQLISEKNSLSQKSAALGLPSAGLQLETNNGETVLTVAGRDLACDLLLQKAKLQAQVSLQVGPTGEAIMKLNEKLKRIEKVILDVRKEQKEPRLAAALLGYRLSKEELALSFSQLLDEKNLQLSANWETFGSQEMIRYEKSKSTAPVTVILGMETDDEQKVNAIDKEMAALARLNFEEFTPAQRAEFERLNIRKSFLIKKTIMNKMKRKNHDI